MNRFMEEKKGIKVDYVTLKKEQVVLTLAWSAIVAAAAGRLVYALSVGENFWAFVKYT